MTVEVLSTLSLTQSWTALTWNFGLYWSGLTIARHHLPHHLHLLLFYHFLSTGGFETSLNVHKLRSTSYELYGD